MLNSGRDVDQASGSSPRVEALNPSHLRLLLTTAQVSPSNQWADQPQAMLFQSWLLRKLRVLVALEPDETRADQLLSLVVLRSLNRRSSCWQLELEERKEPRRFSRITVIRQLLHEALSDGVARSQSWLIRCDSNDQDQLDLARELGFQPLRRFAIWRVDPSSLSGSPTSELPPHCRWSALDNSTAKQLFALEQACCSTHHRQLLDRQWQDLVDQGSKGCGLLEQIDSDQNQVLAGLVARPSGFARPRLELLRGLAWDDRLMDALPPALERLAKLEPATELLVDEDDERLQTIVQRSGFQSQQTQLLLGRSLWRKLGSRELSGLRPLESMLGRLQPQQPPLPTPTLGRER
tara:strand:+ start:88 stop:1137 length:1050 start_codon:yes stop_codon:yes gene_type:complete